MLEIALGVVLFTGIVLVLALVIMLARSRLVPSGNLTINVNRERDLSVPVGDKLLAVLAADGEDPEPHRDLADLHMRRSRYADAMQHLQRCLALAPDDAQANMAMGACLQELGRVDEALEISAARLSALSVLVFSGACSVTELARLEQVRQPTMSHLLRGLEDEGLVRIRPDDRDGRVRRVEATRAGRRLLEQGRRRRVAALARWMEHLPERDVRTLARAAELMRGIIERSNEA